MTSVLGLDIRVTPLKHVEFGEDNQKTLCFGLLVVIFSYRAFKIINWKETSGRLLEQESFCSMLFTFIFIVSNVLFSTTCEMRQILISLPKESGGSGRMESKVGNSVALTALR